MPVKGPRKLREVYPYLSQRLKLKPTDILSYLPSVFLSLAAIYGVIVWISQGYVVQSNFLGFPIYTVYPPSLIIFGGLGAILSAKYKWQGLLAIMSCAAFFDLAGILSAEEVPSSSMFVVFSLIIGLGFLSNKKSLFDFMWTKPFLVWVIVMLTGAKWLLLIKPPNAEPFEESVWALCFVLAFYGGPKKKVSKRHEIQIADITYHP